MSPFRGGRRNLRTRPGREAIRGSARRANRRRDALDRGRAVYRGQKLRRPVGTAYGDTAETNSERQARREWMRTSGLSARAIRRLDRLTKRMKKDGADVAAIEAVVTVWERRFRHRIRR